MVRFSGLEYAGKRKLTRREKFLASMEEVVPWDELIVALKPHYPEGKRGNRPPIGLDSGFSGRKKLKRTSNFERPTSNFEVK